MPDLHAKVCRGWQRYAVPREGVSNPRKPAERYPMDWDFNLP